MKSFLTLFCLYLLFNSKHAAMEWFNRAKYGMFDSKYSE